MERKRGGDEVPMWRGKSREEIRGKVETSKELEGQRNKIRGGWRSREEERCRGLGGEEERRYPCGEERVGRRYAEKLKLRKSWRARGIK